MTRILIVDDDPPMVEFLERLFGDSGYQTLSAFDGITALRELFTGRPDLAIIDLRIPHMDGLELCRRIRIISRIPIIVLTSEAQILEKVNAYNAGANDYIVKPVRGQELLARVETSLQCSQWTPSAESSALNTDLQLIVDFARREVFVDGVKKDLTSVEYSLLNLFLQQHGEAFSLEGLITKVWGREYANCDLVNWHISLLLKKLVLRSDDSGLARNQSQNFRQSGDATNNGKNSDIGLSVPAVSHDQPAPAI